MRYASIREMDVSNGEGVGVSLFTQGCHFHCKNCFNQVTWDFNGGKPYTQQTEDKIRELVKRPYIHRFSILGGEPIEKDNIFDLTNLLMGIKEDAVKDYKDLKVWLYTGYSLTDIIFNYFVTSKKEKKKSKKSAYWLDFWDYVVSMLYYTDRIVDGPYVENKKDYHLKFCGSSNQRIVDTKKTFENMRKDIHIPEIMAYCNANTLNAAEITGIYSYLDHHIIVEIPQESI